MDVHRQFHETWLGEAQPSEGLTFSVPVLCDAGVLQRLSAAQARELEAYLAPAPTPAGAEQEGPARLVDLRGALLGFFGWTPDELHDAARMPEDLLLRLAEEGTELQPTLAIPYGHEPHAAPHESPDAPIHNPLLAGEQTPASRAGAAYQLLVWELPPGLDLAAPESQTSTWHYPPSAKFERLLRETRVPMGLLCNGELLRLFYCPHGQATGWLTFHVDYMASSAGRDMLSALRELLHADRVMGSMPDTPTTLELFERSRDRQADVTTRLGQQVLEALQILLEGFEAAAHRDGDLVLREAMRQAGNHVYEGLLTVMLRLIFALYAEDRGLLPVEHPLYAEHLGVGGLYDTLVADADAHGDTMDQRFGAWPRLIMLFRALYFGLEWRDPSGDPSKTLSMPPHRGHLFNPENYAFLEGCLQAGAAPVSPEARAGTRLPSISDGVVLRVLRRLLVLDGQRLSYSALEEEQLGSVYEGLMGYAIERRMAPSVCLAPSRVWVSPADLLGRPAATRVRWLQDAGVTAAAAKRLAAAVEQLEAEHERGPALDAELLASLREFGVAAPGKRSARRRSREQLATEVAADRLVIQPGEERRRTSSHYTPRSLSGPIVERTLEPLLAAIRARVARERPELADPQPSAADLLALEVCDPAMGSGAFLVETCRFLAKHVVAAWVREGTLEREIAASGDDEARRQPEQLARRMVAQRCLLGVDKNPLAVELGKLSLWLLTLSRGQTFTFLDHCLKAGDSLVGLSKAQILAMDWSAPELGTAAAPSDAGEGKKKASKKKAGKKAAAKQADAGEQLGLFVDQTKRAFAKATLLRQQLGELAHASDRDDVERRQHELHVEAERALERLRDVADILLSSYFWPSDKPDELTPEFLFGNAKISDKQRKDCLERVRDELNFWLMGSDTRLPRPLELRRSLVRECIRPMHWEVEFPEVFSEGRRDPLMEDGVGRAWVDAVVGNPPFAGKNGITETNGAEYLTWLTSAYVPSHGNSDLSAYFFRRADWMLGAHGTLGLIAKDTIKKGDTRATGLQPLVRAGVQIYDATRDMRWPVKGANVTISIVHMAKGAAMRGKVFPRLDGGDVEVINSELRPSAEVTDPARLGINKDRAFVGSYIFGQGFVLTPEEYEGLANKDSRNLLRMSPYMGGQEFNIFASHQCRRYVIDFGGLTLDEANEWPLLINIIRSKVKPERELSNRDVRKKYWWRYAERAAGLYSAIRPLKRCLATSLTAKHRAFAFLPTSMVMDQTLIVIAMESASAFGILQSRIHDSWATKTGGAGLEVRSRYSPSRCFETFPFPDEPTLAEDSPLEAIAKLLYETRATYMVDTDQGLTKTYNALKDPSNRDPDIVHLRELHEKLDRAVLSAYGQSRIAVPPYADATPEQLERFEDAVLDFLFARNALLAKREASGAGR